MVLLNYFFLKTSDDWMCYIFSLTSNAWIRIITSLKSYQNYISLFPKRSCLPTPDFRFWTCVLYRLRKISIGNSIHIKCILFYLLISSTYYLLMTDSDFWFARERCCVISSTLRYQQCENTKKWFVLALPVL